MCEDKEDNSKRVTSFFFFFSNLLYDGLGCDSQLNEGTQSERDSGEDHSRAGGLRDGGNSQGVAVKAG